MHLAVHHHVSDPAVQDQERARELPTLRRTFAPKALAPSLRAHRLDRTVLAPTATAAEQTPELLTTADRIPAHPGRGGTGRPQLMAGPSADNAAEVVGGTAERRHRLT